MENYSQTGSQNSAHAALLFRPKLRGVPRSLDKNHVCVVHICNMHAAYMLLFLMDQGTDKEADSMS